MNYSGVCLSIAINSTVHDISPYSLLDISAQCIFGRNDLTLRNISSSSIEAEISVDMKIDYSVEEVLQAIPPDHELKEAVFRLNIGTNGGEVKILGETRTNTCPITLQTIAIPVKGKTCTHVQTFDARNYLELAASSNRWLCPICKYSFVNHSYDCSAFIVAEDLCRV